jgi:hypothetical protein
MLYYILMPFVYFIALINLSICGILFGINWILCGDIQSDGGISFVLYYIAEKLANCNDYIYKKYMRIKPIAWTFNGSVKVYREIMRIWIDRCQDNYEYRQMANLSLKNAKENCHKKEIKFWSYIIGKIKT